MFINWSQAETRFSCREGEVKLTSLPPLPLWLGYTVKIRKSGETWKSGELASCYNY